MIDLRNAMRDETGVLIGEGSSHDTSRYQNSHDTSRNLPVFSPDIKTAIYKFVLESGGGVSTAQIAKAVERKKSPWLVGKIKELVSDGYLTCNHTTWKNGVLMYLYEVASGTVSQADR